MSRIKIETEGQRILRCREEARISREELAERSGVSLTTIAGIESGRIQGVTDDFLRPIAAVLGVTLGYLRDGVAEPTVSSDDAALDRYAAMHFQHHEVRDEFLAFARETVSFRCQRWGEADLVAVERAFCERNSGLVELECFSLPGDSYGNG